MTDDYLSDNASNADIWHALRLNVEACYLRYSQAQPGSQSDKLGEILVTPQHAVIDSESSFIDDSRIDSMLDWYRSLPESSAASPIIWYINPTTPQPSLSARLLARGVSTNWEAHWMWAKIEDLASNPISIKDQSFDIHVVDADDVLTPPREDDAITKMLTKTTPRMVWHIIAQNKDGNRVGGCFVNITTGDHGIAGLFDMWVEEEEQRKGIGSNLLDASIRLVQNLGCHYIFLNSTEPGERLYLKRGFRSIKRTITWHLASGFRNSKKPTETMVKFLEALFQGNIELLDELLPAIKIQELQESTVNGTTPLRMTVDMKQPASAKWLIDHAVVPDVLSFWDLDWKDKIPQLLIEHPDQVNKRQGGCNESPLHAAVARHDIQLAQILLNAPNIDLTLKDDCYNSTPIDWARVLDAKDILALLLQYTSID